MPGRVVTYVLQELEGGQRKCRICCNLISFLALQSAFKGVGDNSLRKTPPTPKYFFAKHVFPEDFFKMVFVFKKILPTHKIA